MEDLLDEWRKFNKQFYYRLDRDRKYIRKILQATHLATITQLIDETQPYPELKEGDIVGEIKSCRIHNINWETEKELILDPSDDTMKNLIDSMDKKVKQEDEEYQKFWDYCKNAYTPRFNLPEKEREEFGENLTLFTGEGYVCEAHKKGCFFCKHLTDIFYDSSGPYMFICDRCSNESSDYFDKGLSGKCEFWEEEEESESNH